MATELKPAAVAIDQMSSLESEQAILGGFLVNNDAYFEFENQLSVDDFYNPEHRLIFQAIRQLSNDHHSFDYLILVESIKSKKTPQDQQKLQVYLIDLVNQTPSQLNLKSYVKIVKNYALVRKLHTTLRDIAEKAGSGDSTDSIEGLLDYAEQKILGLNVLASTTHHFNSVSSLAGQAVEQIQHLGSQDSLPGVESGFVDLDQITLGLQPGDMIIVAGRPSMGKTAFAMNIAEHVAYKTEKTVAVFSLEMSSTQLIYRLLSALSGISAQVIRRGKIPESANGWPKLNKALDQLLGKKKLFINDQIPITPSELRAQCRRFKREHDDLSLIVIDYLQLIYADNPKPNRNQEITEISHAIKSIAKELGVPILVLSQLSRGVEQRDNKRPRMSDLRESGSIEQDADVIMMIYRDVVYNKNTQDENVAEVNIVKQRNGPIGSVRLYFEGQKIRFSNLESGRYDQINTSINHDSATVEQNNLKGLPDASDNEENYLLKQIQLLISQTDGFNQQVWDNLMNEVAQKKQNYHLEAGRAFNDPSETDNVDFYKKKHQFYEVVYQWMQKQ